MYSDVSICYHQQPVHSHASSRLAIVYIFLRISALWIWFNIWIVVTRYTNASLLSTGADPLVSPLSGRVAPLFSAPVL